MQSIRITLRGSAKQSIRKYKKKSMDRVVADSSRSKKKSITLRASLRAWPASTARRAIHPEIQKETLGFLPSIHSTKFPKNGRIEA